MVHHCLSGVGKHFESAASSPAPDGSERCSPPARLAAYVAVPGGAGLADVPARPAGAGGGPPADRHLRERRRAARAAARRSGSATA